MYNSPSDNNFEEPSLHLIKNIECVLSNYNIALEKVNISAVTMVLSLPTF